MTKNLSAKEIYLDTLRSLPRIDGFKEYTDIEFSNGGHDIKVIGVDNEGLRKVETYYSACTNPECKKVNGGHPISEIINQAYPIAKEEHNKRTEMHVEGLNNELKAKLQVLKHSARDELASHYLGKTYSFVSPKNTEVELKYGSVFFGD